MASPIPDGKADFCVTTAEVPDAMEQFSSTQSLVKTLAPTGSVICHRPAAAEAAGRAFLNAFPGRTLYAVKTNPAPVILNALSGVGLCNFDVASLREIELIQDVLPNAKIHFMHPVKSRHTITNAYRKHGIRTFALDSPTELTKIREATNQADDLTLMVRVAVPNTHAAFSLDHKFGISLGDASPLLHATRQAGARLGICFHVGSQCMQPAAYGTALRMVAEMVREAGIMLDIVDVGGGFPALYPGLTPPPIADYMREIKTGLGLMPVPDHCEFWCEPGRALVAEAGSTLVQVDGRKEDRLYINDGTYGSLFDAGVPGFRFPVRCIRPDGNAKAELMAFSFYGPTCDSLDTMPGPFMLPSDMREGDYIEIGQTGAYGATMRTQFNGFYSAREVILQDLPLLSRRGLGKEADMASGETNVTPLKAG